MYFENVCILKKKYWIGNLIIKDKSVLTFLANSHIRFHWCVTVKFPNYYDYLMNNKNKYTAGLKWGLFIKVKFLELL